MASLIDRLSPPRPPQPSPRRSRRHQSPPSKSVQDIDSMLSKLQLKKAAHARASPSTHSEKISIVQHTSRDATPGTRDWSKEDDEEDDSFDLPADWEISAETLSRSSTPQGRPSFESAGSEKRIEDAPDQRIQPTKELFPDAMPTFTNSTAPKRTSTVKPSPSKERRKIDPNAISRLTKGLLNSSPGKSSSRAHQKTPSVSSQSSMHDRPSSPTKTENKEVSLLDRLEPRELPSDFKESHGELEQIEKAAEQPVIPPKAPVREKQKAEVIGTPVSAAEKASPVKTPAKKVGSATSRWAS